MSRSSPPPSNTADGSSTSPEDRPGGIATADRPRASKKRKLGVRFAALMRWLHIYLSMFSLAVVLFFSVTGITLNHPDWFYGGVEHRDSVDGAMDPAWLRPAEPFDDDDPLRGVDKLRVVEHLRAKHGVRGALADFSGDDRDCSVTFKGPGYAADAFISRKTGTYQLTVTAHGLVAVINDLHKGRDTGPGWSLVIDLSAVLLTVVSLTGLVLLFYLKLRRVPGLIVVAVGAVATLAAYLWFIA